MDEIEQAGTEAVTAVANNAKSLTQSEEKQEQVVTVQAVQRNSQANSNRALKKGDQVTVKKSATNFGSKSGGKKMASHVPGSKYTVYQTSGSQVLIGRDNEYTGWVNLRDLEGYAKGTKGVKEDQLAIIDELGDELQLVPDGNGRLAYLKKGTAVLNSTLTERLMDLAMNPQEMLDRNRPSIGISPEIRNTEINISMDISEVVHIDTVTNETVPNLAKTIEKQMDKYVKKMNAEIRKYTR